MRETRVERTEFYNINKIVGYDHQRGSNNFESSCYWDNSEVVVIWFWISVSKCNLRWYMCAHCQPQLLIIVFIQAEHWWHQSLLVKHNPILSTSKWKMGWIVCYTKICTICCGSHQFCSCTQLPITQEEALNFEVLMLQCVSMTVNFHHHGCQVFCLVTGRGLITTTPLVCGVLNRPCPTTITNRNSILTFMHMKLLVDNILSMKCFSFGKMDNGTLHSSEHARAFNHATNAWTTKTLFHSPMSDQALVSIELSKEK